MAVIHYGTGALPTAQDVTNLYLYGQQDKPTDMLDPSIGADNMTVVEIDYATF